ncbi:30S ribosomal protein S9 [Candidatus Woesearchaeota archaeon]|nr:30S ribosomal protein S9 [Candidatus Woesearchaeota archaeon]
MTKVIVTSGKRKRAIARATLYPGSGVVKINKSLLGSYSPPLAREKIKEPLTLAGDVAEGVDILVRVHGGGYMSQAEAARLAISRALVQASRSERLKAVFLEYDRQLLVADVRRKEAKKPNSHGRARAKRQKSYR